MVVLVGNTSQNNHKRIRRFGNLRLPSSVNEGSRRLQFWQEHCGVQITRASGHTKKVPVAS